MIEGQRNKMKFTPETLLAGNMPDNKADII